MTYIYYIYYYHEWILSVLLIVHLILYNILVIFDIYTDCVQVHIYTNQDPFEHCVITYCSALTFIRLYIYRKASISSYVYIKIDIEENVEISKNCVFLFIVKSIKYRRKIGPGVSRENGVFRVGKR